LYTTAYLHRQHHEHVLYISAAQPPVSGPMWYTKLYALQIICLLLNYMHAASPSLA